MPIEFRNEPSTANNTDMTSTKIDKPDLKFLDMQAEVGVTKHIGGFEATNKLLSLCHIEGSREVLNVGCGIGIGSTEAWVSLSPMRRDLVSGGVTTMTGSINSSANCLAVGTYSDTVTVTNITNGNGNTTRPVGLKVTSLPVTGYTITASAGPNSSIAPSGTITVSNGSDQKFTVTPDTGYRVANVLVDGKSIGAKTSYTFRKVRTNHTISASFEPDVFIITATAGPNCSIVPSGTLTVNRGDNATFQIIPDAEHLIRRVVVDRANKGAIASYTFTNVTNRLVPCV